MNPSRNAPPSAKRRLDARTSKYQRTNVSTIPDQVDRERQRQEPDVELAVKTARISSRLLQIARPSRPNASGHEHSIDQRDRADRLRHGRRRSWSVADDSPPWAQSVPLVDGTPDAPGVDARRPCGRVARQALEDRLADVVAVAAVVQEHVQVHPPVRA